MRRSLYGASVADRSDAVAIPMNPFVPMMETGLCTARIKEIPWPGMNHEVASAVAYSSSSTEPAAPSTGEIRAVFRHPAAFSGMEPEWGFSHPFTMNHPDDLDLNGTWTLTGMDETGLKPLEIPATVPGMVHLDLLSAGLIPDPFWRDQAEACQWVEHRSWTYSRHLDLADAGPWRGGVLHFEGLDTWAVIRLDGRELGRADNMFRPFDFRLPSDLANGRHLLEVAFSPDEEHLAGKDLKKYPCAFFTHERLHVRRMQCTYYWDWVGRFVSYGIWKSVRLEPRDRRALGPCHAITRHLDAHGAELSIEASWTPGADGPSEPAQFTWTLWDPDGRPVAEGGRPVLGTLARERISIQNPRLWWPRGYGDQPLYRVRLSLTWPDGVCRTRELAFGVRTVRLEQILDAPGSPEAARTAELRRHLETVEAGSEEPGSSFRFLVNGRPVFLRGGNWVPADPFPARVTDARLTALLEKAAWAGYNMMRLWGGGIYEPDAFYDACDRLGILVAQDFMFACGNYPEDEPGFMARLPAEAEAVIERLRGRTCLAWWIGNNENGMHRGAADADMPGRVTADTVLEPLLSRLDPLRPFTPTSPFGGAKNTFRTVGDSHFAGWSHGWMEGDQRDYRERIDRTGRFQSECAIPGAPPRAEALRFMTEADLTDPGRAMWRYHTKDNPHVPEGRGSIHDWVEHLARALYGVPEDPRLFHESLEMSQYEWVRLSLEAARRHQGYTWGMLFWMFNDCWPASGWSQLTWHGVPKAALYAFRRAASPVSLSLTRTGDTLTAHGVTDGFQSVQSRLEILFQPWSGAPRLLGSGTVTLHGDRGTPLLSVAIPDKVDLSGGAFVARFPDRPEIPWAPWFNGMPRDQNVPETALHLEWLDGGQVAVSAPSWARVVTLVGGDYFGDNYFDLLPGERRVVAVHGGMGTITARAWNAPAVKATGSVPEPTPSLALHSGKV